MREFNIYVETNRYGLVNQFQKDQLRSIICSLKSRYINLLWQVTADRLSYLQVINILRLEYFVCRKKNITVHNEFNIEGKSVSSMTRRFLKKLLIELYESKCIQEKDYNRLFYGNEPEGCAFSSCLGSTIFIQSNEVISICPCGKDILLNPLKDGGRITEIFETEKFKTLLQKHIQKRNVCRATCQKYDLCHGSCPLLNDTWESCETMKKIMDSGQKITKDEELEQRASRLAALYRG